MRATIPAPRVVARHRGGVADGDVHRERGDEQQHEGHSKRYEMRALEIALSDLLIEFSGTSFPKKKRPKPAFLLSELHIL